MVPGEGRKRPAGGILGVDADLDGVTVEADVLLAETQRFPGGDPELEGDQVFTDDGLGRRMLDLEAGVHFEKIEVVVLIDELDGSGVDVAAGPGHLHGRGTHGVQRGRWHRRRRRLLDELLVAALGRAVTGAQIDGVAVGVGEDLHLDVPGPGEVPLEVALGPAEGLLGFPLGGLQGGGRLCGGRARPACPARRRRRRP